MTKKEIKSCGKREGVADGRTGCSFLFHLLYVCVWVSPPRAAAATKVKTPLTRSHPLFLIIMLIWLEKFPLNSFVRLHFIRHEPLHHRVGMF